MQVSQYFCTMMAFSSSNKASVVASPKQHSHEGVVLYGLYLIGLVSISLFDSAIARIEDYSGLLYLADALQYFAFMDRINLGRPRAAITIPPDGNQEPGRSYF